MLRKKELRSHTDENQELQSSVIFTTAPQPCFWRCFSFRLVRNRLVMLFFVSFSSKLVCNKFGAVSSAVEWLRRGECRIGEPHQLNFCVSNFLLVSQGTKRSLLHAARTQHLLAPEIPALRQLRRQVLFLPYVARGRLASMEELFSQRPIQSRNGKQIQVGGHR